jgi:hypothetical protein
MAGTTGRLGNPRKVRGLAVGKVHTGVDFRLNVFFLLLSGSRQGDGVLPQEQVEEARTG